jgi:hypothetical protein
MWNRICQTLSLVFVLALVLIAASCSTNKFDGKWEGTTSQGKMISFTVNGGVVTTTRVEFELKCERPGFCPAGGSAEQDLKAGVSGNSFSGSIGKANLSGQFNSETTAAGNLKVAENDARCGACNADVTWTAKKL